MSDNEDFFLSDTILISLAEQHKGDIPKLLETIAGYLARKTDFLAGGKDGEWQKIMRDIFDERAKQAQQEHKAEEKKKRLEAKQRREEEWKKQSAAIYEVTDEEAATLQQTIDEEKNKKNVVESTPKIELSKPLGDEADDESDRSKLKANKGRGCNLEHYMWTQTLEEVELKVPLTNAVRVRDITIKVLKKKLVVGVKDQPAIINGELHGEVKHEDLMWQLDDEGKTIVITLEKLKNDWWNRLMTTDPEVKIKIPEPEENIKEFKREPGQILNDANMESYLSSFGC